MAGGRYPDSCNRASGGGDHKAVHPSRKISAYKIGDRWRMEIDGARRGDIAAAIRGIRDDENSTSGTGAGA